MTACLRSQKGRQDLFQSHGISREGAFRVGSRRIELLKFRLRVGSRNQHLGRSLTRHAGFEPAISRSTIERPLQAGPMPQDNMGGLTGLQPAYRRSQRRTSSTSVSAQCTQQESNLYPSASETDALPLSFGCG